MVEITKKMKSLFNNLIVSRAERTQKKSNKKESEENVYHLLDRLEELKVEIEIKEQNFYSAEKEYVDIAVNEWNAAKDKYSLTLKELKDLWNTNH